MCKFRVYVLLDESKWLIDRRLPRDREARLVIAFLVFFAIRSCRPQLSTNTVCSSTTKWDPSPIYEWHYTCTVKHVDHSCSCTDSTHAPIDSFVAAAVDRATLSATYSFHGFSFARRSPFVLTANLDRTTPNASLAPCGFQVVTAAGLRNILLFEKRAVASPLSQVFYNDFLCFCRTMFEASSH